MKLTINSRKNGPLALSGDFSGLEILDAEGKAIEISPVEVAGIAQVFLCRCGASSKKPFCDGSHIRSGFEAS